MKLYKKLDYLAYRFKYEATYLEMKYHLIRVMKGKEDNFIKRIEHYDRNIGKSCALARLSVKYDIPVAVPTRAWADLYEKNIPRYIPKYFKKKRPKTIVVNENSKGKRYDVILLEECVPENLFNVIIMPMVKNGVVGYKSITID